MVPSSIAAPARNGPGRRPVHGSDRRLHVGAGPSEPADVVGASADLRAFRCRPTLTVRSSPAGTWGAPAITPHDVANERRDRDERNEQEPHSHIPFIPVQHPTDDVRHARPHTPYRVRTEFSGGPGRCAYRMVWCSRAANGG